MSTILSVGITHPPSFPTVTSRKGSFYSVVFSGSDANQFGGSSTTTFANVQMNISTVERLLERTTIALYPNATDDELTIRLNTPLKGPFDVQLINLYGNLVYR